MAYLKIFPIKVTDKKALDYITNPDKTEEKLLVSSFGCSPETADLEFSMTREMAKKNGMDKGDNLAFHLIQSFKPGEVDAETAHRLGQQFANEVLKGKYEYVISTHVDKNHIHNHIIFNAASFVDHHKMCIRDSLPYLQDPWQRNTAVHMQDPDLSAGLPSALHELLLPAHQ